MSIRHREYLLSHWIRSQGKHTMNKDEGGQQTAHHLRGGGAPSFVGNIDNSAMYDPAKLAGLSTDYVATPATPRRKGKLTE